MKILMIINKIETLSDFKFMYNDLEVDYKKMISIKAKKEPISSVLTKMFSNTNVTFEVFNKQIILKAIA